MSSGSQPAIDGQQLLLGSLLKDYLTQLTDSRLSEVDKYYLRMNLELKVEEVIVASGTGAYRLFNSLRSAIFSNVDTFIDAGPAINWLLEFLAGRKAEWLAMINAQDISRIWKDTHNPSTRSKALHLLLLIGATTKGGTPEENEIPTLFKNCGPVGAEFTPAQREIVSFLMQEALGSVDTMPNPPGSANFRAFAIGVLLACFPKAMDAGTRKLFQQRAFQTVGELGDEIFQNLDRLFV